MFLPYATIEEREKLVLIEQTQCELGVDYFALGRHSSIEVYFQCVVCSQALLLSKKRILDGKGLTHPGLCRTTLKRASGKRARQNENPIHKEVRANNLRTKIKNDSAIIIAKRQATLVNRYGTKNLSQIPSIRENISNGVRESYLSGEALKKRQETNILKYSHTNYLASPQGIAHLKQVNSRNLKVEYPFQSSEIREKCLATIRRLYGVDNYRQLPLERNKLKQWCEENPEKLFTSKGEQGLLDWIREYYPTAKKYRHEGFELDVFIPELNLGIEYNGLWWHSEANKTHSYHLDKTKHFVVQGIRTVHIWEHEWLDRQDQVKSFLLSAMGKNSIKLNSRQCNILWSSEDVEIAQSHQLLDTYHIQGHRNSTRFVVNVRYDDELIATATFDKHHRGQDQWVLSRFCTKANYTVRGLLGKISKIAYTNLQQPILSWADYRLSLANGYTKCGWKVDSILPPDYFYFNIRTLEIVSKQSRQKNLVGTPDILTERQHAYSDGLERIWDCGKIRLIYNPEVQKE